MKWVKPEQQFCRGFVCLFVLVLVANCCVQANVLTWFYQSVFVMQPAPLNLTRIMHLCWLGYDAGFGSLVISINVSSLGFCWWTIQVQLKWGLELFVIVDTGFRRAEPNGKHPNPHLVELKNWLGHLFPLCRPQKTSPVTWTWVACRRPPSTRRRTTMRRTLSERRTPSWAGTSCGTAWRRTPWTEPTMTLVSTESGTYFIDCAVNK